MVIKNSTPWQTEDLRKLFRRCVREVEKVEKPNTPFHKRNKNFQLDILNTTIRLRGMATIEGYWIMIKIPVSWSYKTEMPSDPDAIDENGKYRYNSITSNMSWICLENKKDIINYPYYWKIIGQKEEIDLEYRKDLARIMIHEYYHSLGVESIDARNYRADFTRTWNVDWVSNYPIRKKEIAKKELVDIKLRRYQRAIQNLRKAETRFRRAKTLHNKWLTKVKRYQKVYNFN